MKRAGNLFERIVAWDNLRLAFAKALRGKRDRPDAREFSASLDIRLRHLAEMLEQGPLSLGEYRQFVIYDPKERVITAPSFSERVLHHGVINVCEPVFERWLVYDTYACRAGKGRIAAVERARGFSGRHGFFLKLDIRKYFDSISHDILLSRLARLFKDRRLLELFGTIVTSFRGNLGRGLPIGSLTSQHFANFYLGWLDRFVKESLRIKAYVRYMDDMVLWHDSADVLNQAHEQVRAYLADELDLELKANSYLNRTSHGVDFLGCRVLPGRVVLNARSRRRFRRKMHRLESQFLCGEVGQLELQQKATSLVAFTRTASTKCWRFRQTVLEQLPVSGHRPPTG